MKILVGCERSGIVRRAFAEQGHDAWSVDLEPSLDDDNKHLIMDVVDVAFAGGWDLAVFHPPCTHTTYASGVHWKKPGWKDKQQDALNLFYILLHAPIERIAIENPRGLPMKLIRPPDDVIQPYEFGHDVTKRTYLWLKNLPPLMRTLIHSDPIKDWTTHRHGFSRSITFPGIADAMSKQWGTR